MKGVHRDWSIYIPINFLLLIILSSSSSHLNADTAVNEPVNLSHLLVQQPEQDFFKQFSLCSIAASNMRDVYYLEGKLVESVLTGLEAVAQDRDDTKKFSNLQENDPELKKLMYDILHERDKENRTSLYFRNPINALHFLIRVSTRVNPILNSIFTSKSLMKRTFYQDLRSAIERLIRQRSLCWPSINDVETTIQGLVKIGETYKLDKYNMIKGILLPNIAYGSSLEPLQLEEALVLLQEANRQSLSTEVLEWSDAIDKYFGKEVDTLEHSWRSVTRMRSKALFKLNKKTEAIQIIEQKIREAKFDTKLLKKDLKYYQSISPSSDEDVKESDAHKRAKEVKMADDLCLNSSNFKLAPDSSLRCYYRKLMNGWDRSKIELLSKRPLVYKYHEIINEIEILGIFDHIKRNKIQNHEYGYKTRFYIDRKFRKENAVVWDEDSYHAGRLGQKISYNTALNTESYRLNTRGSASGPFFVTNFGIGGYSKLTTEYLNDKKSEFGGDRMATWLYYLSDSFNGGNIVFPKANLTVSLEKGSGLLWYNLYRNGTINPLSESMECPVIDGSKWIAKKHIYENGNLFQRKCIRRRRSFF